eukprot:SAG22_NODE_286_length_12969_cov_6.982828_1_plen_51_part_10
MYIFSCVLTLRTPPRGVQWYHPQTLLAALTDHCWVVWASPAMLEAGPINQD